MRIETCIEDNNVVNIDIIVFNTDFDSHLQTLRNVSNRFRIFNIKTFPGISRSKITSLSHEISRDSYSPANRNIKAVQNSPTPTTSKGVKRFIGMSKFFSRFIRNFATIAAPLREIIKDNVKFSWGLRQEEAFNTLRTYWWPNRA